jgi:hypothetical protein
MPSTPSAPAVPQTTPAALSIRIVGDHFVDGAGVTIRLLGVNAPGSEYACQQDWGYSEQPSDAAEAAAIAGWHATVVRVPLNEDCWLGINGQPAYGSMAGYRNYLTSWVATLNAAGLYVILDLHWTAPGTNVADGQRPMPDDHSVAFWTSVASTFASNHAVVFDAFNEPYSPAYNGNSTLPVSWTCWRDGGCPLPVANQDGNIDDSDRYTAVGMQAIVNAIRATGATQPIMLGGLRYGNDLTGWLGAEPVDPQHQLAASFHNYKGNACASACWNSTVASVAASVPVVTGEFDEGYDCAGPPAGAGTFDNSYFQWADAHGVSYVAWGWWVLGNRSTPCSSVPDAGDNYVLISNYDGTPAGPDGTALKNHLAALASTRLPVPPVVGGPPRSVCHTGPSGIVCTQ